MAAVWSKLKAVQSQYKFSVSGLKSGTGLGTDRDLQLCRLGPVAVWVGSSP